MEDNKLESLNNENKDNENNIDSSRIRKERDVEEIINILADDTSDINLIGKEEESTNDEIEQVSIEDKLAIPEEEPIKIDLGEVKIDPTPSSKELEPVKKVAKVEIGSKKHKGIKSVNIDKKHHKKDKESKASVFDIIDDVFRKQKRLIFLIIFSIFIFAAFIATFYLTKSTEPEYKIFELEDYSLAHSTIERHRSGVYKVLNEELFDGGEIYFLKDVENRQQLSLIIKSKSGKVIVFDGGWSENAEKLTNLIKELGGTVNCWFITHCDPDHIGAIYEITGDEKFYGIKIERIAYSFFKKELYSALGMEEPWFYEAVIKRFLDASENKNVILLNDLNLDQVLNIDDVSVRIISDTKHLYKMDNYFDNNVSCCYKVTLNGKTITILGDIARDASDLVLRLNDKEVLKSDIVVMSHHGQDGANKDLYEAISPDICLWGTPDWLYENKKGQWFTNETIKWMKDMQIEKHCISKDGDWILR